MPVTKTRNGMEAMMSLDQTNTTRFLFGDEDEQQSDLKSYLQAKATDDNFPILVRHEKVRSSNPDKDKQSLTAICSFPRQL
jgi:hypothetical protein